jgi:hypothetical protein
MPEYEYRFKNSTGSIALESILDVENDALAKAHGETAFATFLDFDSLEIWLLDRHIETLQRAPNPNRKLVGYRARSAAHSSVLTRHPCGKRATVPAVTSSNVSSLALCPDQLGAARKSPAG